jgi:propanol-preferring alcohol dehydrogenase
MLAWQVAPPAPIGHKPLRLVRRAVPRPGPEDLLIRVTACAVCRADLHLVEGDLPLHRSPIVPGHEIVGRVVDAGLAVKGFTADERVGVAWLRSTCSKCMYCRRGAENLCTQSQYTGWDADGGYAEYVVAPADFVYRLPAGYPDEELAPLLCAGIIGYRALLRTELPHRGRLGIYGFGASAFLAAQVALARGARLHVMTGTPEARDLARALGATFVGDVYDMPPDPLDAAILFGAVGDLVPTALAALGRGGTLVVAGMHLSDIPTLNYQSHLFHERSLRSVTANTRADGRAFLEFAAQHRLAVTTTPYSFEEADRALTDLAEDRVDGAAVLLCDPA